MRCAFALIVSLAIAAESLGGVVIVSETARVDAAAGVAAFTVVFDARPDFWTVDEFDRVADSFQYEIDDDWKAPPGLPAEGLDTVVRGDEIRIADALRVRDATFGAEPDPDPSSGGWGQVRAEVPFELDGSELRFSVPLAALGDDDGYFAYRLFTTEYGLTTSEVESRLLPPGVEPIPGPGQEPAPIPLPPAAPGAVVTLALLGGAWAARRYGAGCLRSTIALARNPSGSKVIPK
jgi:hypothetical protein